MELLETDESQSNKSPVLDDSIGTAPVWIIRWGILSITILLFLVVGLSAIIKYPQIIESTITITTQSPPIPLTANANGKLQYFFTSDGKRVQPDETLAVIENTSRYENVTNLKMDLVKIELAISNRDFDGLTIPNYGSLGDLQIDFNNFIKAIQVYQIFLHSGTFNHKIKNLRAHIEILDKSKENLVQQEDILKADLELSYKQFLRDSILFNNKVLSDMKWEESKKLYLKDQYSMELAKANILSLNGQKIQLLQTLQELQDQYRDRQSEVEHSIIESFNSLKSQIRKWEKDYIIKSPCVGKVVLNEFWAPYQPVKLGDNVLIIIPESSDSLIGRIRLPVLNSGKVKMGQKVNIKLDSYPYIEYGMIKGEISKISSVPDNNFYAAEVELPNQLITTYNKQIDHQERMSGTAEIITDDISLLERFFLNFFSIFNK